MSSIPNPSPQSKTFDWPHAPVHRLGQGGVYIVTAGKYQKQKYIADRERLEYVTKALLVLAKEHGLRLQAWAVFSNHYHLVAEIEGASSLVRFIRYLHSVSAKYVNRLDETPGRKVWHQDWDTHLTYHDSFLARLKCVHTNPVKHRLVQNAGLYDWCSAAWFARTARNSFRETVLQFPSDNLTVPDNYDD